MHQAGMVLVTLLCQYHGYVQCQANGCMSYTIRLLHQLLAGNLYFSQCNTTRTVRVNLNQSEIPI